MRFNFKDSIKAAVALDNAAFVLLYTYLTAT